MNNTYKYDIKKPNLSLLGYIVAVANVGDKHDRSAPSDYHWKILKCRYTPSKKSWHFLQDTKMNEYKYKMIIFSNSSILACPDKRDVKQVHIIFNKLGDDYDKLNSLFLKFSLSQEGAIRAALPEVFLMCFQYTLTAKLAPVWNTLGYSYLINNRDFLTAKSPQEGVQYHLYSNEKNTRLEVTPVKINLMSFGNDLMPGEWIRILPSLNKAIVEECVDSLPKSDNFKSYKDIRRHWKNIHGYRLPEEEGNFCKVRFWRGEPLTYPKICVLRNLPVITPMPKSQQAVVAARFVNCLKARMPHFLGQPLTIYCGEQDVTVEHVTKGKYDSQAVSLCTPTQPSRSKYN